MLATISLRPLTDVFFDVAVKVSRKIRPYEREPNLRRSLIKGGNARWHSPTIKVENRPDKGVFQPYCGAARSNHFP